MKNKYTSGSKTRITIRIDDDVLGWFKEEAEGGGGSYQALINRALREYILAREQSLEEILRRVIREEFSAARSSALSFKSNTTIRP